MKRLEIPETGDELIAVIRELGPGPSSNAMIVMFEMMNPDGEAVLDQLMAEGRIKRIQIGHEPMRWVVTE